MNGVAIVGKEGDGEGEGKETEGKESKKEKKEREKQEKEQEKQERERQKQEEKERKQNEKREKEKEKKKPKEKSPAPEETKKSSQPTEASAATSGTASTARPDLVTVVEPPGQISGAGQPIGIVFDTAKAGEGQLSAACKGTKVGPIETEVMVRTAGNYHVQFVPDKADVYMLSVHWGGKDVAGSPFLINLNLLPSPSLPVKNKGKGEGKETEASADAPVKPEEKMADGRKDGASEGGGEEEKEGKVAEGQGVKEEEKKEEGEKKEEEKKEEERKEEEKEEDSTVVVSDDPFEMAFQASRMLGKCCLAGRSLALYQQTPRGKGYERDRSFCIRS